MDSAVDEIVKEVIDVCCNMCEPERTAYLLENFSITRNTEEVKIFRDPKIPNAYKEYNTVIGHTELSKVISN